MQESTDNELQQAPPLVTIELRVLGALMEKQLTTPDQYPLTLNSLMSACNQKSSRHPVSNHSQGEIIRALQELEHKRFVSKEYGSRAEKYDQRFIKQLELGKKHQALLCVMMLRGPQTLNELHTRTQRMVEFAGKEDLEHTMDRLCNRAVPFAVCVGQKSGQRDARYMHLFSGAPSGSNTNESPEPQKSHQAPQPAPSAPAIESNPEFATLESLQAQVNSLQAESDKLKQQLSTLYLLTGHSPDSNVD